MFYLIIRIKDKKPCSCCRHSNSTIVFFQQGNAIMYLFDEIWILYSLSHIVEKEFVSMAVVLGLLYFSIPKDDKFTSSLEWVALKSPISSKTNAAHGTDVYWVEAVQILFMFFFFLRLTNVRNSAVKKNSIPPIHRNLFSSVGRRNPHNQEVCGSMHRFTGGPCISWLHLNFFFKFSHWIVRD